MRKQNPFLTLLDISSYLVKTLCPPCVQWEKPKISKKAHRYITLFSQKCVKNSKCHDTPACCIQQMNLNTLSDTSCVLLHAEQTKLNPWFILGSNQSFKKVVSNAVVFFYSLSSPSLYTLCCFSFSQMVIAVCFSRTQLWFPCEWGAMILYRCVCLSVCERVCLCVGVLALQFSFHWSVLGFTSGPIRWRVLLKRCCRFHLTTMAASLRYVHAFVRGRVARPDNQHSLSVTQKQDPTSLLLLTDPFLLEIPPNSP